MEQAISNEPSEGGGRSHKALTSVVTAQFVARCLVDATAFSQNVVRCIVLENILFGRAAGLMQAEGARDSARWLADYVQRVNNHYQREYRLWTSFLQRSAWEPLYTLLQKAARQQMSSLRARYPGTPFDEGDLVHETLADLRLQHGILNYPFDLPLLSWLSKRVRHTALKMHELRGSIRYLCLDDSEDLLEKVCIDTDEVDLDLLAVRQIVSRMSTEDQIVYQHLVEGLDCAQTADCLGIAPKTVYKRRKRVTDWVYERMVEHAETRL